ncbi:toxin-antitoxin system HicB family antitoxin [Planomonospora venezuelensis]|uniref:toxin-antitoxin system HicB family antitoxin n=1 Tax=Planomonospora venezuelensis TaxID=1999 RepID=UPI0016153F48
MDEKRITLRLPAQLHARLVAQAGSARRSLNSEIVYRLENGLDGTAIDVGSSDDGSALSVSPQGRPDSSPA